MPKITVKKNDSLDKYTTIEIREPTIGDAVTALAMCQKKAPLFLPALLSVICTFDGKQLPMEDIQTIPVSGLVPMLTELFSVLDLDLMKFIDRVLDSLNLRDSAGTTSGDLPSENLSFS